MSAHQFVFPEVFARFSRAEAPLLYDQVEDFAGKLRAPLTAGRLPYFLVSNETCAFVVGVEAVPRLYLCEPSSDCNQTTAL